MDISHQISKDNSFFCDICGFSTKYKYNYTKHLKSKKHLKRTTTFDKEYKYICQECDFTTNDKNNYNRHLKSKKHILLCNKSSVRDNERSITPNIDTDTHTSQQTHTPQPVHTHNDSDDNKTLQMLEILKHVLDRQSDTMAKQNNTMENVLSKVLDSQSKPVNQVINNVQNIGGTHIVNNTITVEVLNERCPDAPTISQYVTDAMSNGDIIPMIKNGYKFHEIFENTIVNPMKEIDISLRPLLMIRQKTKKRRKNLFVKTSDGWKDDTNDCEYVSNTMNYVSVDLHRKIKGQFNNNCIENGDIKGREAISYDEYSDMVYNVREPFLTDCKDKTKKLVIKSITENLEVDKNEVSV